MDNNKEKKESYYKPAIMMFANISSWVVGPIIIALVAGKYLDKKYNSDPWFFIGLTIVAFIISIISIGKILMKYIKSLEEETKKKKSESPQNNQDIIK